MFHVLCSPPPGASQDNCPPDELVWMTCATSMDDDYGKDSPIKVQVNLGAFSYHNCGRTKINPDVAMYLRRLADSIEYVNKMNKVTK